MTARFTDFVDATAGSAAVETVFNTLTYLTATGVSGSAHYGKVLVGSQVRFYKYWVTS